MKYNKIKLVLLIITFNFIGNYSTYAQIATLNPHLLRSTPTKYIKFGNPVIVPPMWIVAFYSNNTVSPICTGEMVTGTYVLTASHCVPANNTTGIRVAYVPIRGYFAKLDSVLYYPNSDIALVKLSAPGFISKQTLSVYFYHNYYYDNFSTASPLKLSILGYGDVNDNTDNFQSVLYKLRVLPLFMEHYLNSLLVIPLDKLGGALGGDSGGPLVNETEPSLNAAQLLGINSVISFSDNKASNKVAEILLSSSVLQWISNVTGRVIFSQPEDNKYFPIKNNKITISGWGKFPNDGFVLISSNKSKLEPALARCTYKDIQQTDNSWKCEAKFSANYKFDQPNYKAQIVRTNGQIIDFVYFKLDPNGTDLAIISPKNNYTYYLPVGTKYLIKGDGYPGRSLDYALKKKNITNSYTLKTTKPCINTDAYKEIPNSGIWKCVIKASENGDYKLEVAYQVALKPTRKIQLVTTKFSVSTKNTTPSITITLPTHTKSILSYDKLQFIVNVDPALAKQAKYVIMPYINTNGITTQLIKYSDENTSFTNINESLETFPIGSLTWLYKDSTPNYSTFKVQLLSDKDNVLVESSISYFIAKPILTIASVPSILSEESSFYFKGTASYYDEAGNLNPITTGSVIVAIYFPQHKQTGNSDTIPVQSDGTWQDTNPIEASDLGAIPEPYSITATLFNAGVTKYNIAESKASFRIVKEAVIKTPHNS